MCLLRCDYICVPTVGDDDDDDTLVDLSRCGGVMQAAHPACTHASCSHVLPMSARETLNEIQVQMG